MINPTTGLAYSGVPVVQITEEVIPNEGSSVHQDGRLYDLGQVSPGSRILSQNPIFTQNVQARGLREGFDRPLGNPVQTFEGVSAGVIEGSGYVDTTAGLSTRDARTVERHIPEMVEGAIPTTNTYTIEQTRYAALPENITTSVYYPGQQVVGNQQFVGNPQVVGNSQIVGNPQILVSGPVGMEAIERRFGETTLSEIPLADPLGQHMRDSANLGRVSESPLQKSRWELNQSEVSNMRYQNHQTFENWEVNRNVFVTDRLNIMDDLLAGMERKLEWLEVGVQKVILFFKERESQEHQYAKRIKHSLPQLGEHFESINQPDTMFDFSRGMKESDAFHAKETRNSEILALFIKKDILDWILIPSEKNYKLQSNALRTPLYSHRKRLDHLSSKRARSYNKYFKLYDKLQKNPQASKKENKIFKRQLKYSLAAREELRLLKLYCEQGLIVISEFTTLAQNRILEVQKAFSLYLQKYTELNQNTVSPPEIFMDLIERANGLDGMRLLFTPNALMSIANYDFLRNRLTRPELSYFDLENYLVNFPESVDPAHSSFILKEWEAVKEGNVFKKPRACTIIATTGNSILIVERKNEEQEMAKVKDPLQLRFTKVEGIEAGADGFGTTVNIVERAPGTLFSHTHKNRVRFETQEEASTFLSYVNNQTAQLNGEALPLMTQGLVSGGVLPLNNDLILNNGLPMTTGFGASQVSPITTYQNNLVGSQFTPVNGQNVQYVNQSGQYLPTQSGLVSNQLASPANVQTVQYVDQNGQYLSNQSGVISSQLATPVREQTVQYVDQSGLMASQPNQRVYQTGVVGSQISPVNQVGQMSGEL